MTTTYIYIYIYIICRGHTWPNGDTKFLFRVLKNIRVNLFENEKTNIVSPSDYVSNVLFII